MHISAPTTEKELLDRTECIAGKTISQIASQLDVSVPANQNHHKGWVGNLAETYLGATASNQSEPDFQYISVELKTVPMSRPGIPKESTYVCTLNLTETTGISWEYSTVYKKLKRVLWLPVESDRTIAMKDRRFGNAILWSPDIEQERALKNDWEEIMDLVSLGELDKLSSSIGTYLQIRPKAANAKSLGKSYNEDGRPATTLPRGFYLRTSFTRSIFEQ
ncbi:MAG: DNA mismatch repair endonuclease MutH [Gammaproteobacteria bacterium]|nr:DNA mismatch repair endonuclease MutH [Gammaproteobacteria bacterium]